MRVGFWVEVWYILHTSKHAKRLYCNIQFILLFYQNKMQICYIQKFVTVMAEFGNSFLVLHIKKCKCVHVLATKACEGVDIELHLFLFLALVGGEWSDPCPAALPPEVKSQYPLNWSLDASKKRKNPCLCQQLNQNCSIVRLRENCNTQNNLNMNMHFR